MEQQFNLQGKWLEEQPHNNSIRYSSIYVEFNIYWERRDRIWETLKYFYFSKIQSRQNLWKKYNPEISMNSISTHLRKLNKNGLIRMIAQKVGMNRSEKYYEITSKGIKVCEKLLDELVGELRVRSKDA